MYKTNDSEVYTILLITEYKKARRNENLSLVSFIIYQ